MPAEHRGGRKLDSAPCADARRDSDLRGSGEHRRVPAARRAAAPDADILVVDDNSPDGTADLADEVGAPSSGTSRCCAGPRKIGIGDAVRAGFALGLDRGYDVVVQIDADLSHDPAALPDAPRARSRRGADAAIGSALRARRLDPALAVVPPGGVEVGQPLRHARARHPDPRRDLRLPRVPRRHAEDRRLRAARARRATASRSSSATACGSTAAGSRRCRSRSPTACAATRRCR